jgi:hypothetical protein
VSQFVAVRFKKSDHSAKSATAPDPRRGLDASAIAVPEARARASKGFFSVFRFVPLCSISTAGPFQRGCRPPFLLCQTVSICVTRRTPNFFSGATKCDILRHPVARRPGGAAPPTHLILRCASKRKRIRRKSAFGCDRLALRQRTHGTVGSVGRHALRGGPSIHRAKWTIQQTGALPTSRPA